MNNSQEATRGARARQPLTMHTSLLDSKLRDKKTVSCRVKRPEPRVLDFYNLREEPTREDIMVTILALSFRGMVKQGSISQSEADRRLDEYKLRLQRNPFPPDLGPVMMSARLDREAIIRENPLLEYCRSLGFEVKRDGANGRFKCQHRFKGGITLTMTYDVDETTPGKVSLAKCEWSKKPSERIIPEYLRWKHSVCERLAEMSWGKVMDFIKTKPGPDGWEAWVYEPGKPGKKVTL